MGGKTSSTTSQVQIPPEVLARYNSVNATAETAAQQPFQQYSTDPSAFVAPITPTQTAGIQNTNAAAGMAQPYFNTATGFALAGAGPVNAQPLDVGTYMNPYLNTVLGSTAALINQNNQQAMAGQTGNAINQGYFGGDRSGIAAAVLQGQQNLAAGQVYSGIASDAYNQAMAAAQQQQGVNLAAQQANRAAIQQTGQSLAELGTGAQGAALAGAQAQLGAGQVEQQTEQAGKTALYNQFLQQQSYPFQVAQFLANIAEGTGALSGNTTTTTQPGGLFSDARLKTDIERIGTGFDGANIYRFRYRGDPDNVTRIGFMAQEVEQLHPEAVSVDPASGFKMVNYDLATRDAAGFARAANDDYPEYFEPRRARAMGGRIARQAGGMSQMGMYPAGVNPFSISELLQAQAQMYGPYTSAGLYGGQQGGGPYGGVAGHVPAANLPVPQMIHGTPPPARQPSALQQVAGLASDASSLKGDVHAAHQGFDWLQGLGKPSLGDVVNQASAREDDLSGLYARGGFAPAARDYGGGVDDIADKQNDNPYQPKGMGLDIPTSGPNIKPLEPAKPPSGGGGDQTMSDIMDIAKIAAMFAAKRGGRIGRAAGGGMEDFLRTELEGSDNDPVLDSLLRGALGPHEPPAGPGFASADGAKPPSAVAGEPAGGGGGSAAPSAGFAGAGPPRAISEASGAGPAGLPAGFAGIYKAEGTGKNPFSSARGPGQFIDSTFKRMFRKVFPDRAAGMSDADILALRHTPEGDELSMKMIPALDAENADALRSAGLSATPANRHLAWVLGSGGAKKVLRADPSTPMESLFGSDVIGANRRIMAGKTAGDFVNWAAKGMNKGGRAGFQDGGDTGLVAGPDDTAVGFDPQVIALAAQNRKAAAEGQPSTPAAQAAVADSAGPRVARGLAQATDFSGANQSAVPAPAGAAVGSPDYDYLTRSEADTQRAREFLAEKMMQQQGPQGGGIAGMLQRNYIPILQGLAAWAGAPTQHPLVALTQGLGAFATGEQNQRAYQMAQDQKLAEIAAAQENVSGGVYGQRTGRIQTALGAAGQVLPMFDRYFPEAGRIDPDTGEKLYLDLRPGQPPNATVTESQRAQLEQQTRLGMISAAFDPSGATPAGLMRPIVSTTQAPAGGGPAPGVTSNVDRPVGDVSRGSGAHPGVLGSGVAGDRVGGAGAPPSAAGAAGVGPHPGVVQPSGPLPSRSVRPLEPNANLRDRLASGEFERPATIAKPDLTGLDPNSNPAQLRHDADLLRQRGYTDQANVKYERAAAIEAGTQDAYDANNQLDTRFHGYNQAVEASDAQAHAGAQVIAQRNAAADAFFQPGGDYSQQSQIINDLIRTYRDWDTEAASGEFAHLISRARSVPWLNQLLGDRMKEFQDAYERGNKEAARLAMQGLAGPLSSAIIEHAPASGMHQTSQTLPNPTMGAGARYQIVGQLGGMLGARAQGYRDWQQNKDRVGPARVSDYDTAYAAENPQSKYDARAFEKIPYFAGMTPAEKAEHPRHPASPAEAAKYPPGTPFVIPGRPGIQWRR